MKDEPEAQCIPDIFPFFRPPYLRLGDFLRSKQLKSIFCVFALRRRSWYFEWHIYYFGMAYFVFRIFDLVVGMFFLVFYEL